MSKSLYERSLEALVEKLEARVAELETENALLRVPGAAEPSADVAIAAIQNEPASLPFDSSPRESRPPAPTKRLNDAEKRAALVSEGWVEHTDIAQQNISVCWERGAQWYSLEDAYGLLLKDREANQLLAAGWQPVIGIDEREFWKEPGTEELIPQEYAIARLRSATAA